MASPTQIEYRIIRADGEVRWARSTTTPVTNEDGPVQRVVTAAEDITQLREAADRLRDAEAVARAANGAKNELLSRMSHELRTPSTPCWASGNCWRSAWRERST